MKLIAIAFGLLGSILPALAIWLAFHEFAPGARWMPFHTLMVASALIMQLPVLATVIALWLGKKRVALWSGGISILLSAAVLTFFWQLSKGIAAGWH